MGFVGEDKEMGRSWDLKEDIDADAMEATEGTPKLLRLQGVKDAGTAVAEEVPMTGEWIGLGLLAYPFRKTVTSDQTFNYPHFEWPVTRRDECHLDATCLAT